MEIKEIAKALVTFTESLKWESEILKGLNEFKNELKFNPNHVPSGGANGGQFTTGTVAETTLTSDFTEAKTIQDAQQWAKDNLKSTVGDMKGVNIGLANDVNKTLFKLETDGYPPVAIKFTGVEGKAYMQYDWKTKEILLRKNYKEINSRLNADNLSWQKQYGYRYTVSENITELLHHEYGHHLDNISGRKAIQEIDNLDLETKNKAYGISGYASVDRFYMERKGSELIAELPAAKFKGGIIYNQLPDELKKIIEKKY